MPKINKLNIYPFDLEVSLDDFLLGSDKDNLRKTKNYPVGSLIQLLEEVQGISTLVYVFGLGISHNQSGYFTTNNNAENFGNITYFQYNKINANGINVSGLFNVLVNNTNHLAFKIAKPSNPNTMAYYKVTGYEEHVEFFKIEVELLNNAYTGTLQEGISYSISLDVVKAENFNEDKHYIHDQATSSDEWICDHGLSKLPAVTVLDSSSNEVEGEIIHTSNNQTIIKFNAPFSGKAIFN